MSGMLLVYTTFGGGLLCTIARCQPHCSRYNYPSIHAHMHVSWCTQRLAVDYCSVHSKVLVTHTHTYTYMYVCVCSAHGKVSVTHTHTHIHTYMYMCALHMARCQSHCSWYNHLSIHAHTHVSWCTQRLEADCSALKSVSHTVAATII